MLMLSEIKIICPFMLEISTFLRLFPQYYCKLLIMLNKAFKIRLFSDSSVELSYLSTIRLLSVVLFHKFRKRLSNNTCKFRHLCFI